MFKRFARILGTVVLASLVYSGASYSTDYLPIDRLQLKPVGRTAFSVSIDAHGSVRREQGEAPASVRVAMQLAGYRESSESSQNVITENWFITSFNAEASSDDADSQGFNLDIPPTLFTTLDREIDGTLRSIYMDYEAVWEAIKARGDAYQDFEAPEPQIGDVLGLISIGRLPSGPFQSGSTFGPHSASELRARIREEIIPAIQRGIKMHGHTLYMRQFLAIAETIATTQSIEWRSQVFFKGTVVRDGGEYMRFEGPQFIGITDPESGARVIANLDSVEMLIDPYSGQPKSYSISGGLRIMVGDQTYADLSAKGASNWAIQQSIPSTLSVSQPRIAPSAIGGGTIESVYSASIPAVLDVVTPNGSGTGFAISQTLVVTAAHVVNGAPSIAVVSYDDTRYMATIAWVDVSRDLAILRVNPSIPAPHLSLSSDLPTTGAQVLVIGSPAGLRGTLTTGVVSAMRIANTVTLVQIDAAINPGNSGGPVLNTAGQVVGMISVRLESIEGLYGLGFAVSSVDIKDAAATLR